MISDDQDDDVSGLAGWMYTDLLLGLMVIFLATITFIPEKVVNVAPPKPEPKPSVTSNLPGKKVKNFEDINFLAEFQTFSSASFKSRLDEFKKNEKVSGEIKIVSAQLIGSYDSTSEDTGAGVTRALEFGRELEGAFPNLLKGVDASVETFVSETPKVFIRLTFRKFE